MNRNVNGVVKSVSVSNIALGDRDDEVITIIPEEKFFSFRRPFSRSDAADLQESWPQLESALKEYGIACALDHDQYFITSSTTPTTVGAAVSKTRHLHLLLSVRVPVHRALRILEGPYDIIRTGHHFDGICTKYKIKRNDLVVVIGGSDQGLKLVRQIVSGCIVRTLPPGVTRLRDYLKVFLGVKKLSL
ncbi:uncharacterized protein LOC109949752 [Prunus persica]|uniref:uncharacterized protein LOC109949752 n=1 Tax=Prunus persica TaxID=3760 RepID=UPI0009AB4D4E|nr:uncharacterized protein LOC109949752 [Prunus persica]